MVERIVDILSRLFIGFTFFHSKDSLQGTQNKLFVSSYAFGDIAATAIAKVVSTRECNPKSRYV